MHAICLTSTFKYDGDICLRKNKLDSSGLWFLFSKSSIYNIHLLWLEWCSFSIVIFLFSPRVFASMNKKSLYQMAHTITIFTHDVIFIYFCKFDMEVFLFAQPIHINLTFYVKCTLSLQARTWFYSLFKISNSWSVCVKWKFILFKSHKNTTKMIALTFCCSIASYVAKTWYPLNLKLMDI